MKQTKNIVMVVLFSVILLVGLLVCAFMPAESFSEAERRELASFPAITTQSLLNGDFMDGFELYATERFPSRDVFRSIKAWFSTSILQKKDNNKLFFADGHLSKLDGAENEAMMNHAAERFSYLVNTYMQDKNVNLYFSIVPDKNYFLAEKNGYPALDYKAFVEKMREKTKGMQYIDVSAHLSLEDYYTTDTHWRQENLTELVRYLAGQMGASISDDISYTVKQLENPFYGVYAGQWGMKVQPDTLYYLTNDIIENCKVTYYDTGAPKTGNMYNMEKAYGKDPYEMFLSGAAPLVTLENEQAETDKELILFRDSYGSSLAPLLTSAYKKITLVDIRYIKSSFVGNFVDFENADVLFLYSTSLLNNSLALQ